MLAYLNKAIGLLGFRVERLGARSLRFQRASKDIVIGTILFYTFLGWFGVSLFDVSQNLGERGAGCALQFVFSPKTVRFFFIAVILMALYLLRPHLKPIEATVGKRHARTAWRVVMFFAFLWVGFYQALGAVVLGIAIYVAQHEFKTSLFFFLFAAMSIGVGALLKLQGPELLWQVRRKARPSSLVGAAVSMLAVLAIAVIAGGLAYGGLVDSMKAPKPVQCPQPSIVWG